MQFMLRVMKLILGLFLCSFGIIIMIRGGVGYSPWEVFHVGIAKTVGLSLGTVTIGVGIIIVAAVFFMGEKLGLGTLANMVLIGVFIDWIDSFHFIPTAPDKVIGLGMFAVGMTIAAYGTYLYIASGFGAGPRDSLMVAVTRRIHLPVGICRAMIEVSVTVLGYFLGGMVGVGTIFCAFLLGPMLQGIFRIARFDPEAIRHETLADTWKYLRRGKTLGKNSKLS